MKIPLLPRDFVLLGLAAVLVWVRPDAAPAADPLAESIQVMRDVYSVDRATYVSQNLNLTEKEAQAFWPIYRDYRGAMEKLGDGLTKVVRDYAEVYPKVTDNQARDLLKRYAELERKLASTRETYLKKFAKALPAAKAFRFAQLENRMDVGVRAQLALVIPLGPQDGGSKADTK